MKLTKKQHELINSMFELSASEIEEVEQLIWSKSKPVKPQHLDHDKCVAAVRGTGTDTRN